MPPCKGHKKSRNGCIVCKRRRIKCDETRPTCRRCAIHNGSLSCRYNSDVSSTGSPSISEPSSGADASNISEVPVSLPIPTQVTEGSDLYAPEIDHGASASTSSVRLPTDSSTSSPDSYFLPLSMAVARPSISYIEPIPMQGEHSYQTVALFRYFISATSTTLSLSDHDDSRHLWSQVIPTLSQAHPFLLHSILAITSAHIAKLYMGVDRIKEEIVTQLEDKHFREAMQYFRGEIAEGIHELNCHSSFAANTMCILYLVSRRQSEPVQTLTTPEPMYAKLDASWAFHIRQTCVALHGIFPLISNGPIARLIEDFPPVPSCSKPLSKNAEVMFTKLYSLCIDFTLLGTGAAEEMEDVNIATAYYATLYHLRKVWNLLEDCCIRQLDKNPGSLYSAILFFVLHTPAAFWAQLRQKSPRALIIYAYLSICWEGLDYGLEKIKKLNETTDLSQRNSPKMITIGGRWWTVGRAEMDLKGVQDELDTIASNDTDQEIWREWIDGAWVVMSSLKQGRWLDRDVTPSSVDESFLIASCN